MKFKNDIEAQAGFKDAGGDLGVAGQLLSSTGTETNWIDQSTIASGSAEVVEVPVKNLQGSALTKGDPVYISGSVGASGILEVQLADAGNAAKMPAVGLLKQDLAANAQGFAVVTGKLRNLITSPIDGVTPNPNTVVYVKSGGSTGAALTTVKPGGSTNLIQNVGKVGRVSTSSDGTLVVSSILRSNDVPNLPLGRLFVGTSANTSLTSDVVYIDDANDRVGIGTTSPATTLHVNGFARLNGGLQLNTTNAQIYQIQNSDLRFGTNNTERMRIDSLGNVGIGTTSPGRQLELRGQGVIKLNAISSGDPGLDFDTSDVNDMQIRYRSTTDALAIYSYGTSSDVLTIKKSDGNVGIGTTSPTHLLTLETASSPGLKIKDTTQGATLLAFSQDSNSHVGTFSSHPLVFDTNSTERMRIDSSGNVGIGTTSPSQKLDVNGRVRIGDVNYSYGGQNFHIVLAEDTQDAYITNIEGYGIMSAGGYYYGANLRQLNSNSTAYSSIHLRTNGDIVF
jgi:hypothetical protein